MNTPRSRREIYAEWRASVPPAMPTIGSACMRMRKNRHAAMEMAMQEAGVNFTDRAVNVNLHDFDTVKIGGERAIEDVLESVPRDPDVGTEVADWASPRRVRPRRSGCDPVAMEQWSHSPDY